MILKKINSLTSLIAILAVVCHLVIMSISLWTGWYNYAICKTAAHVTAFVVILHVVLSVLILCIAHDGANIKYVRQNMETLIQRISAVVMLLLIHLHIKAYAHVVTGETLSLGMTLFHMTTEVIFFCAVLFHIEISFPKALITLGLVRSPKAIKVISTVSYLIGTLLLLFACTGAISFYLKGLV